MPEPSGAASMASIPPAAVAGLTRPRNQNPLFIAIALATALTVSLPGVAQAPAGAGSKPVSQLASTNAPMLSKLGEGRLRFFGLHVYDSSLWTDGPRFDPNSNFALEIRYAMGLKGDDIALRSIQEMRTVGYADEAKFKDWLAIMRRTFPDITKGERLVGVASAKEGSLTAVTFFHGDKELARIDNAEFARAFFDIWLSPKTSQPALRKALLGEKD
jgi:hypothetical protein